MEEAGPSKENAFVKNLLQALIDAWWSLVKLVKDPIGGLEQAIDDLGPRKSFNVSLLFMVLFAVSSYMLGLSFLEEKLGRVEIGDPFKLTIQYFLKLVVFSFVPYILLFLSIFTAGFAGKEKKEISVPVFLAGVISLPLTVVFFTMRRALDLQLKDLLFENDGFHGLGSFVLVIFGLSLAVLMLNAALTNIYRISSKWAILIIPLIYSFCGYLAKLTFDYLVL